MIEKLMTKFDYTMDAGPDGGRIAVIRLADGATKEFYIAAMKTPDHMDAVCGFMDSITDELAEGYFPKPRKK